MVVRARLFAVQMVAVFYQIKHLEKCRADEVMNPNENK